MSSMFFKLFKNKETAEFYECVQRKYGTFMATGGLCKARRGCSQGFNNAGTMIWTLSL